MKLMQLYNNSPIWIQNILTTLKGYHNKKIRYGEHYQSYLSELRKQDYSDYEKLKIIQDNKVKEIVQYAFIHSPFYRDFYKDIDIKAINSAEDLTKLPILEKETVRSNIKTMYTIPQNSGVISNTSGTTGTSMTFIYTKKDIQRRLAYLDFFKEQNGFIHMNMKRASFNSSKIIPYRQKKKIFWRDNGSIKQRLYSGQYCQGDNLKYYVENLNIFKPQALDGYPSAIYQISRYILKNNIILDFKPIAIFPTAETLLPHYKNTIEKAFQCKVLDQYASSEGAPFIVGCKEGNLHYCMDTGAIEVDSNGYMIVTCFDTHGTPLIRYNIGDKIKFSNVNKCKCGSSLPVVERIEGRGHDYLISKTKGNFPELWMSIVSAKFQNTVKAMQFVQDRIDEIKVFLEVDENYDPNYNEIILDELRYIFGEDMLIIIEIVDIIPKEASGKFRLIKNNMI